MSVRPPDAVSLRDILDELRLIRQAIEDRRRSAPSLSREDRATLARILPVVAAVYEAPFTSRDLADDTVPAVRLVVRGRSAKSIGRLLARAEGIPIDGLMVQRDGRAINVLTWQIVACVK